jgi:hypothetical protein
MEQSGRQQKPTAMKANKLVKRNDRKTVHALTTIVDATTATTKPEFVW